MLHKCVSVILLHVLINVYVDASMRFNGIYEFIETSPLQSHSLFYAEIKVSCNSTLCIDFCFVLHFASSINDKCTITNCTGRGACS
jgi:hypothetical protein